MPNAKEEEQEARSQPLTQIPMAAPVPGSLQRQGTQPVDTDSDGNAVALYYELHRLESATSGASGRHHAEPVRLVLIMGFAATSGAWRPLLLQLQYLWAHQDGPHIELLLMDNRGVGNSSSPRRRTDYSTVQMARDVLNLMDFVAWHQAHVVGFSMGGMIATKLVAEAADRCHSVTLLSVSQGGWDVLPRSWRALKIGVLAAMAGDDAEERAKYDLKMHYTRETLKRPVPKLPHKTVQDVLLAEYVAMSRLGRPQPEHGFKGQMAACWHHGVTKDDVHAIKQAKAPVWLIHGRQDLVAPPHLAEALATRLGAPCVRVDGAHFIPRENAIEVALLMQSIVTSGFPPARLASIRNRTQLEGLALEVDIAGAPLPNPLAVGAAGVGPANGANGALQTAAAAEVHRPGGAHGGDGSNGKGAGGQPYVVGASAVAVGAM